MSKTQNCLALLSLLSVAFAFSVIDNGTRFNPINDETAEKDDGECSNLSPELIREIRSHQPLVDQITSAIVNGKYSGDTWNA